MTDTTKTPVWLVVGNTVWGKGRSFREAFLNCMDRDSRTYPTRILYVRCIFEPEGWTLGTDGLYKAVSVNELGEGSWPFSARVIKRDIEAAELAPLLKAFKAFREEWDEFVCSDAMDVFEGEANE